MKGIGSSTRARRVIQILRAQRLGYAVAACLLVAACDDTGNSYTGITNAALPPIQYTVGGTVSGLSGSGLLLQLNGAGNTNVVLNGPFKVGAPLPPGSAYSVTIATQPTFPAQTCQVANGTGTANADITNVTIICSPGVTSFTVSGVVSGLTGTGLVLQNNGGDDLAIAKNGGFTFAKPVTTGTSYTVTVSTQPTTPTQSCRVTSGSGVIATANVINVAVVCRRIGQFAYVANNGSDDVSGFKIDPVTGTLTAIPGSPVAAGSAPAIVSLTPDGRFAYVATDLGTKIAAYAVDQVSGALTPIAGSPFTTAFVQGQQFPGISVDPSSKFLYITSMNDSQVAGFAINNATGALTSVPGSPFAAGSQVSGLPAFSPNGAFLYVTNQGSTGSVSGYAIDPNTGTLTPVPGSPVAAGNTPTWISLTPDGKFAYVANSVSNDISAYAVDTATGGLTPIAAPYSDGGNNPGDLTIDFAGTHLYIPDQGSNQISVYAINQADGTLTLVPGSPFAAGNGPALVDIEPSGRFAYVSSSNGNDVYGYSINSGTGALTQLPGSPYAAGSDPLSVTVDPSGKFAYVANNLSDSISGFSIDADTGVLSPVAGGPFPTGSAPFVVSISPEAPGIRD
jgi:6-phosphogluconolactonase